MPSRSLWRRVAISLSISVGVGMLVAASALIEGEAPPAARQLPRGFTREVVVSGLTVPTTFASLPDGRLLIAEKTGVVRLFKDGALQPTPFIDITHRVNAFSDRGLLGLAVDPDFAANGAIYLLYTYEDNASNPEGPKTGRLARYTAVGDTASPDSEFVLLGRQVGSSCHLFPHGADCIPSDSSSHSVGNLKFAPDGTLFVTLGDGARFDVVDDDALRAQDLDSLAGKVLHIDRNGKGVASNPFWNGDAGANRSKVWSYGLRNPYRFNLRPETGLPYLGDVGWNAWEELNVARPGSNLGWPCYEGPDRQPGYEPKRVCQELYALGASAVTMPLYSWGRSEGRTATGGGFYTGTDYPAAYRGAYFFGDYSGGWIRFLRVDAHDERVPGSVATFTDEATGLVGIELGPDSLLHYVDIHEGRLLRFRYVGLNTPPMAVASADPSEGGPPLTVQFSSAGSGDPDGHPLQYTWDFGDGSAPSNLPDPEHTYPNAGVYFAKLTVSDGAGGTHSATVRISVGNSSPVPTIASPSASFRFKVGDVVTYSGSAVDPEEGALPGSRLTWVLTLHHCTGGGECHTHPYSTSTGPSGEFSIGDHGDEVFFELALTATDSAGLTGTRTVTIHPQTVQLTLASSPPGRRVVLDSTSGPAPLTRTVIVGSTHTIYAPSESGYYFEGWSDGGEEQHTITVGTTDATHTAFFTMEECPARMFRAEYFNNTSLEGWPALVRCESAPFSYEWGGDSPAEEIHPDRFSVRWSGRFRFSRAPYTFQTWTDDGVRLWVDGDLLLDAWWDQEPTTHEATIWMSRGEHSVVMEYYENEAAAVASLRWRRWF